MSTTHLNSEAVLVERKAKDVFKFLSDLRNYEALMPEDVVQFEANEQIAKLNLKGLGAFEIHLGKEENENRIVLIPKGKLPFSFNIHWNLIPQVDHTTVSGVVNAELNVFMKMMAEAKLKEFVTSQASKMKAHIENGIPI